MTKIDSKIPEGPVAEKWTNYKAHQKLVNPANKRRLDIIVVGTGLAALPLPLLSVKWVSECSTSAFRTLRAAHTLSLRKVVSMLQRITRTTATPFTVCSTIR